MAAVVLVAHCSLQPLPKPPAVVVLNQSPLSRLNVVVAGFTRAAAAVCRLCHRSAAAVLLLYSQQARRRHESCVVVRFCKRQNCLEMLVALKSSYVYNPTTRSRARTQAGRQVTVYVRSDRSIYCHGRKQLPFDSALTFLVLPPPRRMRRRMSLQPPLCS